jgi:sulfite reductase alpha subunit-like flavoprotein
VYLVLDTGVAADPVTPSRCALPCLGFLLSVNAYSGSLSGVNYAVFGVGNSQWQQTFQAFPKKVDVALKAAGAHQVRLL